MSLPNTPDTPVSEGVPAELILSNTEFMMIRPGLVRELGAAGALVWTRIHWRCSGHGPQVTVDDDGVAWWPAPRDVVADETGLSPEQVRRAIDRLVTDGYLERTEHRHGGNYDRTKSYRPLIRNLDWAKSPNESGRNRPQERADSPNVPSVETSTEEIVNAGEGLFDVEPSVDWFSVVWEHWPKKDNRASSIKLWPKAVKASKMSAQALAARLVEHGNAYRAHRLKSYTPALDVFLRNERWGNDLVEPNGTVSQPGPARPPAGSDRARGALDAAARVQARMDAQAADEQRAIES